MKRLFFIGILAIFTQLGYSQSYKVEGVAPAGTKTVYLQNLETRQVDSAKVSRDGKFQFAGNTNNQPFMTAYFMETPQKPRTVAFFCEGNVKIDLINKTASGGKETQKLNEFNKSLDEIEAPLMKEYDALMQKRAAGQELPKEEVAAFQAKAQNVMDASLKIVKKVLKEDTSMLYPAFVLRAYALQMEEKDKEIIEKATVKGSYLMYKDRPLVRENNVICYGNMDDEYVLCLTIMTEIEQNGKNVPDMVLIQIVSTDESLSATDKISRQEIKKGLFEAFELGYIWLTRLIGE